MKKPMQDTMMREKFDNLYTPREAITPFLPYILGVFKHNTIWECCDSGNSNITKVFKENGLKVISTDIVSGFDFLKDKPEFEFDMIVTNPPYSLKDAFIEKCYEYKVPFALLLPLTALEGIKRGKIFRQRGISVFVLDKRVDFTGKGSNWFNVSWFSSGIFINNSIIFGEVK